MISLDHMALLTALTEQKRRAASNARNGRRSSSMSEGSVIKVWAAGFFQGLSFVDRSGENTAINGAPAVLLYTPADAPIPQIWEHGTVDDGTKVVWPTQKNEGLSALFLTSLVSIPIGFEQTTNSLFSSVGGFEKGFCSPSKIPDSQEALALLPAPDVIEAHPEFWCPKKWQFREGSILLEPVLRELLYNERAEGECPTFKEGHGGLITQVTAVQALVAASGKEGNTVEVNGESHPFLQLTARWSPGVYRVWNYRRHSIGDIRQILNWEMNLSADVVEAALHPSEASTSSSRKKNK